MYEEWKTIPGIETHEVSNFGRVRSKTRVSSVIADGLAGRPGVVTYERKLKGRPLHLHYNRRYIQVSINDHDESVHRLVAQAFLPPPVKGQTEINHKDGNKLNNVVTNLEWSSRSENEKHSYAKLGKRVWNKGITYPNEKGKQTRRENHLKFCNELLAELESGLTRKQIAEKHNMCYRQVSDNINKARRAKESSDE